MEKENEIVKKLEVGKDYISEDGLIVIDRKGNCGKPTKIRSSTSKFILCTDAKRTKIKNIMKEKKCTNCEYSKVIIYSKRDVRLMCFGKKALTRITDEKDICENWTKRKIKQ